MTSIDTPNFDTHPDYRIQCPTDILTATFGKRRLREIQQHYEAPLTMADLAMEKAIDSDTINILDGAWGPKLLNVGLAAAWGLHLTDQVLANAATRGLISNEEAQSHYVTTGKPREAWIGICDGDTLRTQHQRRVFVLSEHPHLFGLETLWEVGYSVGELTLGVAPEAFDVRPGAEVHVQQTTAPFTEDQVSALSAWQQGDQPIRCGGLECRATTPPILSVMPDGLVCPTCGRVREWVWRGLFEGSVRD